MNVFILHHLESTHPQAEKKLCSVIVRNIFIYITLCLVFSPVDSVWAAGKPGFSLWKSKSSKSTDQRPGTTPNAAPAPPTNQEKKTPEVKAGESVPAGTPNPSKCVKLNYFGSTWDVVFKDVAEATGSRLVGNRIPSGRYTRRDSALYTRTEAIRIINKEIESRGFRMLEQDELLVVMDLPSIRPKYQPPEIQTTLQRMQQEVKHPPATSTEDQSTTPAKVQPASAQSQMGTGGRSGTSVKRANHETAVEAPVENPNRTVVVFRPRHRPVLDISRDIFQAYPQRSELLQASAASEQGFRVRQALGKNQPDLQFDVLVDTANDEARIEIPKSHSATATRLFRLLDVPARDVSHIRLMTGTPSVCQIAEQLAPELEQLRLAQHKKNKVKTAEVAQVDTGDAWLAENDADPPQPESKPKTKRLDAATKPAEKVQALPQNLTDVIGNLKGEVTIESFEDLGALILKGAADDVEQVMQVIRQLEKLSEATAPQVHLLYLEHVDSRALAELLSTVYDRIAKFPGKATQPRENVAILPVSKPNAVLIIAPKGDLPSILDLAEELDQPVDPLTEFQVFPLKTAIASQVEKLLTEFYEDRVGLDTRILIRADNRSNTVIIRARPRDLDEAETLIRKLDHDGTAAVSQMQIFPLKNASAAEMSAILNQAIQSVLSPPTASSSATPGIPGGGTGGGGQIAEQFRDVKSTLLQFLAVDAEGERNLRSGLLADIRITPDARMNALVVAAPERSMLLIAELIKNLDRPSAAVAEIKVFPLTNADAQKVVTQLQSLFSPPGQQGGFNNQQQRQQLGIQVVGAEDAGSSLIPLRFTVDSRTNSIIAIGGAEALGVVEAILYRLDEGDIRERKQSVYRLKNSPAQNIATSVTQFLQSQRQLNQNDPNLISSVEQLEREVIVVAEPVSNSLMISATPRYYDEIMRLVKKLDEAPSQVIIQALLVEVSLDNIDEFGVELGFQNGLMFNRSVKDTPVTIPTTTTQPNGNVVTNQTVIAQTATPGFNFANPALPLGNNISASPSAVALQSLSNFSMSRVNSDLGFGGLVLSAGSDTVNVLLRALSSSHRVQILSRPQIRTLDNQTATILQGQVVPVVNGVTISANGLANPQIIQQEAGIILTVTPRVSPDGQIVMDVVAEKSAYRTNGVPIFTDANNGNVIESPIKDIATARAVVSVPSNQTVVIGGLINTTDDRLTRKVPWLGDIPIIGYAFRFDSRVTARKELLIFLTPRLVKEDVDSEMIKDVEMARMHFIEAEAEEVHGPLRGVPAPSPITDEEMPWLVPENLPPTIFQAPQPLPADVPSTRIPSATVPHDVPVMIPSESVPAPEDAATPELQIMRGEQWDSEVIPISYESPAESVAPKSNAAVAKPKKKAKTSAPKQTTAKRP